MPHGPTNVSLSRSLCLNLRTYPDALHGIRRTASFSRAYSRQIEATHAEHPYNNTVPFAIRKGRLEACSERAAPGNSCRDLQLF